MIISASRRTDIPAFYSDWFFNRLKEGHVLVRNPFRPLQVSHIPLNPETLDAIVFWTKNAEPMTDKLNILDSLGYPYYFQYTITPYGKDVEKYVPDVQFICRNFQYLSKRLGKERVIWRYDPIILNKRFTVQWHIQNFARMCELLDNYTETCIFSFADRYVKTDRNAKELEINYIADNNAQSIAEKFSHIALSHGISLKTCCEAADFSRWGIGHATCIDKNLLESIIGCPLNLKADRNQRKNCGCVESIDVGSYDTCLHGCSYCYATYSVKKAQKNAGLHDEYSPLLFGKPTEADTIKPRAVRSNIVRQTDIFKTYEI